jgi:3D (Asp-Asp-Asp) domain-containing protein
MTTTTESRTPVLDRVTPMRHLALHFAIAALAWGCGGTDYVTASYEAQEIDHGDDWIEGAPARRGGGPNAAPSPRGDMFRNTYYDFPAEGSGKKGAKVFDAACAPIADVTQEFHDKVCLQGSGRLSTGETISFAKRDCECAAVCPKSGQKICFEKLDPKQFPSGRGSLGTPIVPLRTVAVDPAVVPLGSSVFIPEYEGMPRPDGSKHDGCFVAEDRGSKVVGKHIDVFTGDPALTSKWNQLMPSNAGVHVEIDAARCPKPASPVKAK